MRVRYDRSSLESAINAAKRLQAKSFVYATAYGFTISKLPPPSNQRHIVIEADGKAFYEGK